MFQAQITRIVAALPDAVTAGGFLILWIAPLTFGAGRVGNAMLVMLVEFVLLHATILVPLCLAWVATRYSSRAVLISAILGFATFYLFFIGAMSYAFRAWWPLVVFTWTMIGKFGIAMPSASAKRDVGSRQSAVWLVSVLAYIGFAFLTLFVPLPELGLAGSTRAELGIPAGATGGWVSNPHRVVAFGLLYFGVLAYTKWRISAPRAAAEPTTGATVANRAGGV